MYMEVNEALKYGYEMGQINIAIWVLFGLIVFYAVLFFYQTAKIKLLMKFLRKRKLVQAYADFRASDEAGKFWKKEELE